MQLVHILRGKRNTPEIHGFETENRMTDKELKRLSREELLQIMLEQSKEIQRLQDQLNETEAKLQDKILKINQAGSLMEASMQLNGVFEAAERACQQYTENIKQLSQRQSQICAQQEQEGREQAQKILAEARQQALALERSTKQQCDNMLEEARTQSQKYWDDVSKKLNAFVDAHGALQQLFPTRVPLKAGMMNHEKKA